MMNIEEMKSKLIKEQTELEKLKEKKRKFDEQLKKKQVKVNEIEDIIMREELNVAKSILEKKGLSMNDLINSINKGDLLELQEKFEGKTK